METDEVQINVWLSRWQCIFSLDTGMFYTVFLIVSHCLVFNILSTSSTRFSGG